MQDSQVPGVSHPSERRAVVADSAEMAEPERASMNTRRVSRYPGGTYAIKSDFGRDRPWHCLSPVWRFGFEKTERRFRFEKVRG